PGGAAFPRGRLMIASRARTIAALLLCHALGALGCLWATGAGAAAAGTQEAASAESTKPTKETPADLRSPRLQELSRALASHDAHGLEAFWSEIRVKGT